ncbi:hypothetical protein TeGR_g12378 [Tetraparma gracilis]|nr:hypothetical protein TeGR_g12378 [Tetraparma gracilis]
MMVLVWGFIFSKAKLRKQNAAAGWWHWYGPTVLVGVAACMIMAEPIRHILQDIGLWEECGANDAFPRVNQTWNDGCTWSSSQYKCQNLCYVQTWDGDCGPNGEGCGGAVDLSIYYDENEIKELLFNTTADDQCHCIDDDKESWSNLSTIGIIFTLSFTYIGFFLLTTGVMWNAQIVQKLGKVRSQYRALRDPEYARKLKLEAQGEVPYVRDMIARHDLLMFSKTTCPFCFKAKEALDKECKGEYEVVELDLMDNASAIQDALKIVTGGRTVPRVFVGGEFIGGGDDTVEKGQSGELGRLVQAAKGRV